MPVANSQLLNYSSKEGQRMLSELERQRYTVLKIVLHTPACPHCQNPVNQIEASGKSLDEFDLDNGETEFKCPHCGTELKEVVPFMPSGSPYRWERKTPANRTYSQETRTYKRSGDGALIEVRRAFGRPLILDLESRRLKPDGTPHSDEWFPVTDEQLRNMQTNDAARAVLEFFARMADPTP